MKKILFIILLIPLLFKSQETSDVFIKKSNINIRVSSLSKNIDSLRMVEVSSFIKNYFGFNTFIKNDSINISKYIMYDDENEYINVDYFLLRNRQDTFTVYLTNTFLKSTTYGRLSGATCQQNSMIILYNYYGEEYYKNSLIHEIFHLLGLEHCDNKNCVMYETNIDSEKIYLCSKCIKSLNN